MTIKPLHIFLSSPGDVSRERQLANDVIEMIESERAYRSRLKLEVVAWEKPGAATAMPAHMEPQEAINAGLKKPSECDIVIVVFWARMGTLLSEKYRKPDGSRYRSGTEYECLDALAAADTSGKPDVLVYRRKNPKAVRWDDPEFEEKKNQWDMVNNFFNDQFQNIDGSSKRSFKKYDNPHDFKEILEADLRDRITLHLEPLSKEETTAGATIEETCWEKTPFPGLRAFIPEEAVIFHGRGREVDELLSRLS